MFPSRGARPPGEWNTQEVLEWVQENDSSKEEIKNRVMCVVTANDLDGHTLSQLAAEKDEIQALFPALKERLAFKSMLRKLFQEATPGFQYLTSLENHQSLSPSFTASQDVHPTSLSLHYQDTATWPNVHPLNLAPTHYNDVNRESPPQSTSSGPTEKSFENIDYPAPLPKISRDLEDMLRLHTNKATTRENDPSFRLLRRKLTYACARFYTGLKNGKGLSRKDYLNIGRTMLDKYPELAINNESPTWATFNRNLSMSIRNLRRNPKKFDADNSQQMNQDGPVPMKLVSLNLGQDDDSDDEDDSVSKVIKDEGE